MGWAKTTVRRDDKHFNDGIGCVLYQRFDRNQKTTNVMLIKANLILMICPAVIRYQTPWYLNSLWPSDTIWRQRSGSTLAQVMACCITAPSHYLNQRCLIISKVYWHSYKGSFTRDTPAIDHWNQLENYSCKIYFESPTSQRVKMNKYHSNAPNCYQSSHDTQPHTPCQQQKIFLFLVR